MLDAHRNGQGGIQPWTHFQEATLGAGDVLYLPFGDITDVATGGVWSNIATVYIIYIYIDGPFRSMIYGTSKWRFSMAILD